MWAPLLAFSLSSTQVELWPLDKIFRPPSLRCRHSSGYARRDTALAQRQIDACPARRTRLVTRNTTAKMARRSAPDQERRGATHRRRWLIYRFEAHELWRT